MKRQKNKKYIKQSEDVAIIFDVKIACVCILGYWTNKKSKQQRSQHTHKWAIIISL